MFKFAIIEDNEADARILERYLKESLKALNAESTVEKFDNS